MHNLLGSLVEGELAVVARKIRTGERIGRSSCMHLWKTHDLTNIAALANFARDREAGNTSFFQRAAFVNYNGLPVPSYPECPYGEKADPCFSKISQKKASVVYLVGGAQPQIGIQDLCRWIERARCACPESHVRGFTWDALEMASEKDGKSPRQAISALSSAGVSSLAGGALVDLTSESPHLDADSVEKLSRRVAWIQATADAELKCEVSWIYGDGDDPEVLTDLLECIRGLQDRYRVFECFSPLLFSCPWENAPLPMQTGYNQLRAIAVARLFLDNIPRIRSSPHALGEAMTQVAQWYGADDAGFVVSSAENEPSNGLADLLRAAGREPKELTNG
jgi:aminodeoxyfutalosine synthase